jgi:hypothetical protein
MKPRQIIENAAFGPEALKIVFEAYDEAWKCIEGNFGGNPATAEAARSRISYSPLPAKGRATPSTSRQRRCA